jgi:hypothetical protein
MRSTLVGVLVALALAAPVRGGTWTWKGDGDGIANWNGPGCWTPSDNPGRIANDQAELIFPADVVSKEVRITDDTAKRFVSLSLGGGYFLTVIGDRYLELLTPAATISSVGNNTIDVPVMSRSATTLAQVNSSGGTLRLARPAELPQLHVSGDGHVHFDKEVTMEASGPYHLLKQGSGTLRFKMSFKDINGGGWTSLQTPSAIEGGTVLFDGTVAFGVLNVGGIGGATLGGTGRINVVPDGKVTIGSSAGPGVLSPGDPLEASSIGTFTIAGPTHFGDSATGHRGGLEIEISADRKSWDRVAISGSVTHDGPVLVSLSALGGNVVEGDRFTILTWTGTSTLTPEDLVFRAGQSSGLPAGLGVSFLYNATGRGIDAVIVTPEPTATALLALLPGLLLRRRSRGAVEAARAIP